MAIPILDEDGLAAGVRALVRADPDLAGIVERQGRPPLWRREPGFESLIAIILEQQVSLASGAAALARLRSAAATVDPVAAAGPLDPITVAALGEDGARSAGLTRQKARYVVGLAEAALDGRFDASAIARAGDDDARAHLVGLLGVGRWTADIYLVLALGRPDVWPAGDLALASALRRAKRLPAPPTPAEQERIARPWRPWRSVAARVLWHAYLAGER